jgi:hypothetical protein
MKKEKLKLLLISFVVLALPLSFISCSGDDDKKGKEEKESIVGTWNFKSVTAGEVKTNSAENDAKIGAHIIAKAEKDATDITFTEDGKVITQYSTSSSYTFIDGVLSIDGGVIPATLKGNTLTLVRDFKPRLEDMELDELIALGITDIFSGFSVTKATVNVNYSK